MNLSQAISHNKGALLSAVRNIRHPRKKADRAACQGDRDIKHPNENVNGYDPFHLAA
ncbi:hypothetical protein GCM10010916_21560 [Paenibacillus abyssi]|uniref:Uncharacterized protein n=1 Tax=Paenibacillus abyssi TaxID=1340531 RepID=A0A917CZY0_9BACL|nr:hypothetical protein GCM10010916_21560 [Paenibacillus abyssi]